MKLLTWNDVLRSNLNKGQLAERLEMDTYDCALPQQWLDANARKLAVAGGIPVSEAYDRLLFGTVWNYPKGNIFGEPAYLYQELKEVMCEL